MVQANKTLSRQKKSLLQQQIHAIVRNSVAKKVEKNHNIMSQHSKECCNKVEKLEEETSIATRDEEEGTKDCIDKEIYVVTEFRAEENDKLCCRKVFMSRHKTLLS